MLEATCLIYSSCKATSTAKSISNSLFMETQNLIQEKITQKSELSETICNSQTLKRKYKYVHVSRKNLVLQEKLEPSKKTVQRIKLRENYFKNKCTKLQTKPDTTKEDYQQLLMNCKLKTSNFLKWEGWSDRSSHHTGTVRGWRESHSSIWRCIYVCTLSSNSLPSTQAGRYLIFMELSTQNYHG